MKKYMQALARHERAKQKVDSLTRDIGIALGRCPLDQMVAIHGQKTLSSMTKPATKSRHTFGMR